MISGELIRLKNLVDDCGRTARAIQREWQRLTPEERDHLAEHIRNTAPQLKSILEEIQTSEKETAQKG